MPWVVSRGQSAGFTALCHQPVQIPWRQHWCKLISMANKHFLKHFCAFYLKVSWKSPGLACQSSQLPVYKPGEWWKLLGCFEVCETYMRCFCEAVEIWFENLCFHKQFLSQMWISDFLFHLQYAIYKHCRSEGTEPLDRSHNCHAPFLTHAQSSKQNINFYFPVFPIYLAQLIHIVLQKVAVEQQLLLILWVKREQIEKLLVTGMF